MAYRPRPVADGIDADVAVAVRAMSREACTTPEAARDQCVQESERFARLLRDLAVPHAIVSGFEGMTFNGTQVVTVGHTAVRIGDQVYDWTARQFDPDAPVPAVMPLAEWQARWPMVRHERSLADEPR